MCTAVSLVILCVVVVAVYGDCDADNGPAGSPECVLLTPYYHKYQWGTCLTDVYIQTVSKGKAECRDRSNTYCYYQCMMETYRISSGDVYNDCACGRDAPTTTEPHVFNKSTTISPTPDLPSWCYSPPGTDCSWYSQCLEKRYACKKKGGESYAIDYAAKFCQLYDDHIDQFTKKGKKWINATRKCLQVQLVYFLRPYVYATCSQITDKAFASHTGCYLNPDKDAPSICELSPGDWKRVFWTVKGSLSFSKTGVKIATQMLNVSTSCLNAIARDIKSTPLISIIMSGLKQLASTRKRRSIHVNTIDEYSITKQVSDSIAEQMNWNAKGVTWFAYPSNITSKTVHNGVYVFAVNIMMASMKTYDLNANRTTPSINISDVMDDVTVAAEHGLLQIDAGNDVNLTKFSLCSDLNCSKTIIELDHLIPNMTISSTSTITNTEQDQISSQMTTNSTRNLKPSHWSRLLNIAAIILLIIDVCWMRA